MGSVLVRSVPLYKKLYEASRQKRDAKLHSRLPLYKDLYEASQRKQDAKL